MKRLFLLRHAQARPSDGGRDRDRALTDQGLSDGLALGAWMKARAWAPAQVLCSDAKRTHQTCEQILTHISAPVAYSSEIYEAARGQLFALLQSTAPDVKSLMMIGHNPSIYELAVLLVSEGPGPLMGRLDLGYAPGTLSVIDFDLEHWDELRPGSGRLIDCASPADYIKAERSRSN